MSLVAQFIVVFLCGVFFGYGVYTKLIFWGINSISKSMTDEDEAFIRKSFEENIERKKKEREEEEDL